MRPKGRREGGQKGRREGGQKGKEEGQKGKGERREGQQGEGGGKRRSSGGRRKVGQQEEGEKIWVNRRIERSARGRWSKGKEKCTEKGQAEGT